MDPLDDPPWIDLRRHKRWTRTPSRRNSSPRDALATPQGVIAGFGGDVAFWLAWLRGELDAELQAWFRQLAESDPLLRQALHSIEQPYRSGYSTRCARAEIRDALEAVNYLTETPASEGGSLSTLLACTEIGQTETDLVLDRRAEARKGEREANQAELRRRIRAGLFALLEEVEIRVAAADEAKEGTQLLEHLVGLPAVARFLHLHQLQLRTPLPPSSLRDRLLVELAPQLFAREGQRWCYRLSFRLFLRARLQHFCRRRGWLPGGPRYRDLSSAFAALSRERIGVLVRSLLAERELFQAAGVPCQQLGILLETAP